MEEKKTTELAMSAPQLYVISAFSLQYSEQQTLQSSPSSPVTKQKDAERQEGKTE